MIRLLPLALTALALAACGEHDGNSTSITFSANSSDGDIKGGVDGNGNLKIDSNGFKADLKLPKFSLDAGDFEMNGVHLYPGSTISGINVAAQDKDGPKSDSKGKVSVSFASPAAATTVRDWLKERLNKAGFSVSDDGKGLTGKTDDGQPFAMRIEDDGTDKSKGTIDMGS